MESITELWTPVLINNGIFKDDYVVSNMGRVSRKHCYKDGSCKFTLIKIIDGKRPVVRMDAGGKRYRKSVAKLVLSSFQYRKGCECANITYLDGNMKNCQLSNLRYTADKAVFTSIELEKKDITVQKPVKKVASVQPFVKELPQKQSKKLCEISCKNYPCFEGIDNLSTDFAKEGCAGYKPND